MAAMPVNLDIKNRESRSSSPAFGRLFRELDVEVVRIVGLAANGRSKRRRQLATKKTSKVDRSEERMHSNLFQSATAGTETIGRIALEEGSKQTLSVRREKLRHGQLGPENDALRV
jgi:hypothetical protein